MSDLSRGADQLTWTRNISKHMLKPSKSFILEELLMDFF